MVNVVEVVEVVKCTRTECYAPKTYVYVRTCVYRKIGTRPLVQPPDPEDPTNSIRVEHRKRARTGFVCV